MSQNSYSSVVSLKIYIFRTIFNINKLKGSSLLSIYPLVCLSKWVNYNLITQKNVTQWCKQTNLENVTVVMVPWYTKLHESGRKPFVPVPSLTPNEKPVGSSCYKLTLHVCLRLLEKFNSSPNNYFSQHT